VTEDRSVDGFVLLNDEPAHQGDGKDLLGTETAAARLADLIKRSRKFTPFTLGIDAGWGMGKSSLMFQLKSALDSKPGIESVWFNAWTAEGADALEGLIKSVLMKVDENILRRALRKISGKRQLLAALRVVLLIFTSYFNLSRVVDDLWNHFSINARTRNEIQGEISNIFQEWAAKTDRSPDGQMLAVFIDDLDRCSVDVILNICEAVKLYLDVPGIVFILGCDQNILAQAAKEAGRISQAAATLDYMEKIVQVTYRKPAPDNDQVGSLVEHYANLSGTQSLFQDSVKKIVIDRTGRNPRRIKRLINGFILEYRLDPGWASFGADILISVILLQHFYPDFYRELARPSGQDVAREFLTYQDLRSRLQLGRELTESDLEFFEVHKVKAPQSAKDAIGDDLNRLQQELPVSFPPLARDEEFVSLLKNLSAFDDFERLLNRLQSRQVAAVRPDDFLDLIGSLPDVSGADIVAVSSRNNIRVAQVKTSERAPANTYEGLRVLWIDDVPSSIRAEVEELTRLGIEVVLAEDQESAREAILRSVPDVLVSDITRGDDDSAGIDNLQVFREEHLYEGPAIFYTGRITPSRQRRADALGASLTTSTSVLRDFIADVAEKKFHRRWTPDL
jgi:CheY-like chemotaxis protein